MTEVKLTVSVSEKEVQASGLNPDEVLSAFLACRNRCRPIDVVSEENSSSEEEGGE